MSWNLWNLPGATRIQWFFICDLILHGGLGGEFESPIGFPHSEICRTQSTLAKNDSAVYTAFALDFEGFYHSSPQPYTFQSNEKVRTREVLATSCSWKSWQPENAYHSKCDLNGCCIAIVIFL